MNDEPGGGTHIRSYHHRNGRMGPQLQQAWLEVAPRLSMPEAPWDLEDIFGPDVDGVVFDIGSGMGHSALALAESDPRVGVVANDVSIRCIAATARQTEQSGLANLRLWRGDSLVALSQYVAPGSLAAIHVWFPDPWPKAAHHKRRLIRPWFARLSVTALRPGGVLRFATDSDDYADWAAGVLGTTEGLHPLGPDGRVPRPDLRPVTNYERRGTEAGHRITDLAYERR